MPTFEFVSVGELTPQQIQMAAVAAGEGRLLRFKNAILARSETNKNKDHLTSENIRELAGSLSIMALDLEHRTREVVGFFTDARAVEGDTALSTDGVIFADRFPEVARDVVSGAALLSIEANAEACECSVCKSIFGSEDAQGELYRRLEAAYRDGYQQGGGFKEPNLDMMASAPQGTAFHLEHLERFLSTIEMSQPTDRNTLAARAESYASASHTLYMLGYQQAMLEHGARSWQRILHPELSAEGPCENCIADAGVIHPIEEPFFEFHPHGVCSMQSATFHFGTRLPQTAPLPNYGITTRHVIRRHPVE